MISSGAFSNFWYMKLVCTLSTQHNVIIISFKSITLFFSVMLLKTAIVLFALKPTYITCCKVHFLGDLLVHGIFASKLGTGFKEFINKTLFN